MKLTKEQIELGKKLTKLQYNTVINVVSGMSDIRAYYAAGGKATNDNSAASVVSRMLIDAKVAPFYQSLKESVTESAMFKFEDALKICKDIAEDEENNPSSRVGAIKQASDMLGWNAPKKQELSGDISISEVVRKVVD